MKKLVLAIILVVLLFPIALFGCGNNSLPPSVGDDGDDEQPVPPENPPPIVYEKMIEDVSVGIWLCENENDTMALKFDDKNDGVLYVFKDDYFEEVKEKFATCFFHEDSGYKNGEKSLNYKNTNSVEQIEINYNDKINIFTRKNNVEIIPSVNTLMIQDGIQVNEKGFILFNDGLKSKGIIKKAQAGIYSSNSLKIDFDYYLDTTALNCVKIGEDLPNDVSCLFGYRKDLKQISLKFMEINMVVEQFNFHNYINFEDFQDLCTIPIMESAEKLEFLGWFYNDTKIRDLKDIYNLIYLDFSVYEITAKFKAIFSEMINPPGAGLWINKSDTMSNVIKFGSNGNGNLYEFQNNYYKSVKENFANCLYNRDSGYMNGDVSLNYYVSGNFESIDIEINGKREVFERNISASIIKTVNTISIKEGNQNLVNGFALMKGKIMTRGVISEDTFYEMFYYRDDLALDKVDSVINGVSRLSNEPNLHISSELFYGYKTDLRFYSVIWQDEAGKELHSDRLHIYLSRSFFEEFITFPQIDIEKCAWRLGEEFIENVSQIYEYINGGDITLRLVSVKEDDRIVGIYNQVTVRTDAGEYVLDFKNDGTAIYGIWDISLNAVLNGVAIFWEKAEDGEGYYFTIDNVRLENKVTLSDGKFSVDGGLTVKRFFKIRGMIVEFAIK